MERSIPPAGSNPTISSPTVPGIAGFIFAGSAGQTEKLEQMVRCMQHERFYTSGTLLDQEFGLAVGWVCHENSYSDCLPIWNERKDVCLVFVGEHFGGASGEESARSLLKLYEESGEKFFGGLNGIFSGFLFDRARRKAVLFNDRYGLSRVYFHETTDGFYFASEAKSLLKVIPALRRLDDQGLGEMFSCGCALQNRSLFAGVRLVPGGSAWVFERGAPVRKGSYFQAAEWERPHARNASEYYALMDETFTGILPQYCQSRQQIGLSLTGGLDSRMILAGAKPAPKTFPCHTFGGMYRDCADVQIARRLAKVSGQPHEVISVTPKFFGQFPELSARSVYYTDGAMDVTGSVELFVNRIVRGMSPVRMTGNYGSEILRSHVAFKPGTLCESIFDATFLPLVRQAAQTYASERTGPSTSFIGFKQVPWHHYARWAVEQSQLVVRSPFLDNELVAAAYLAPSDPATNKALTHRYIADHDRRLAAVPTDRGVVGLNGASTGKLASFWQEFLPRAEYAYDYGMPHWLAKFDRATRHLHFERLFLGRQKFYHFRLWYRDHLANHVKEILLDPRSLGRAYLNRGRVEQIVNAHLRGTGNYTLEIHKLLSAELLQRQLIEEN